MCSHITVRPLSYLPQNQAATIEIKADKQLSDEQGYAKCVCLVKHAANGRPGACPYHSCASNPLCYSIFGKEPNVCLPAKHKAFTLCPYMFSFHKCFDYVRQKPDISSKTQSMVCNLTGKKMIVYSILKATKFIYSCTLSMWKGLAHPV